MKNKIKNLSIIAVFSIMTVCFAEVQAHEVTKDKPVHQDGCPVHQDDCVDIA